MQVLHDQIIYKCDYCDKRFLSKSGAKRHEELYCNISPLPDIKRLKEIQSCDHKWVDTYRYIPGEAVMEPYSSECEKCKTTPNEEKELILNIKIVTAENSD